MPRDPPRYDSRHAREIYLVARRGTVAPRLTSDAGGAEPLVGAEDVQLREVLGKDIHVKYTGGGMGHLDKYALFEVETHDSNSLGLHTQALAGLPSTGRHDVD